MKKAFWIGLLLLATSASASCADGRKGDRASGRTPAESAVFSDTTLAETPAARVDTEFSAATLSETPAARVDTAFSDTTSAGLLAQTKAKEVPARAGKTVSGTETVMPSVKGPAKESAKEPAKGLAGQSVKESAKESAKEPAKASAGQSAKTSARQPAKSETEAKTQSQSKSKSETTPESQAKVPETPNETPTETQSETPTLKLWERHPVDKTKAVGQPAVRRREEYPVVPREQYAAKVPKPKPEYRALASGQDNGHPFVDLGLSGGLKWATCNLGADSPEQYGLYFAWGENQAKEVYSWLTYQWCEGRSSSLVKYCNDDLYGTVDTRRFLTVDDDAAQTLWGGSWRLPNQTDWQELYNQCTWEWTTVNGHNGYKVSGRNGNSLFLPAAGYRNGSMPFNSEMHGYYWSRKLCADMPTRAVNMYFGPGGIYPSNDAPRYGGQSVRPVFE